MQTKKKHIAFLLVTIVLAFTIKSAFFISYYAAFTDTFVENFCVNQENEALQCDGKCYLSKVLDRDDSSEQKNFEIHAEKDLVFPIPSYTYPKNDNLETPYIANYNYQNLYHYLFFRVLLKPPLIG
ncbi:MAG: hypothetical protein L0J45_07565 [Psychroflexus sp.]|nr:hypothetical protein [Psychroflexus sp.]MDN6309362.1 hypothetical protein [Psychroflexus sp.]